MKTVPLFLFFVILLPAAAGGHPLLRPFVSAAGTVTRSAVEPFPGKDQFGSEAGAGIELSLNDRIALFAGIGYHQQLPSDLSGGYGYRGISGPHGDAGFSVLFPFGDAGSRRSRTGASIDATAAFFARGSVSRYEGTDLAFFHSGAGIAPGFLLRAPPGGAWNLEMSVPIFIDFRSDLNRSLSLMLRFTVRFLLPHRDEDPPSPSRAVR